MSALAEIAAAIAKLARLRDSSIPGPWYWDEPSGDSFPQMDESLRGAIDPEDGYHHFVLFGWGYDSSGIKAEAADRELIVTLHRTIDAQLGFLILVRDLDIGASLDLLGHSGFFGKVLTLARAINGTA